MTDRVDVPPGAAAPPTGERPAGEGRNQFGLPAAMALIVGSIIGVGIFNLPTSLAFYGPITLVSMALTTVGAMALALLFAALSRRLPADGGPYAYARVAFGNPLGFANAWSYWITAWAGNAAIAVGWVLYVEDFINTGPQQAVLGAARAGRPVDPGRDQPVRREEHGRGPGVAPPIVKFAVLAFMSTVGLFYITSANFTPWNVSGESTIAAIGGGMAIALFSYLGVEMRGRGRGEGARPGPQRPAGDRPRHDRHRGRLHAVAHRGVRHPAELGSSPTSTRAVLRRGQRHVRRHLGRQRHGRRRHHLRASAPSTAGP